ncbi:MAG: VirB3 family type IV secretion system protein [Selenomonadales bacterium]|nr:VirB3 family type IV secretion system protein [Selenomonadales bacterium]
MAQENDDNAEVTSWYELSFSRGLTEPALIFGVPKLVIVLNVAIAALFIMNFGFWPIIVLNAIIHFASIYVCKNDNQFFEALQGYMNKKNFYGT